MKKKEFIFVCVILCCILGIFFQRFFLHGLIPFPGDLLISHYSPWRFYSYLGYNPGSYPTKVQYDDVIRQLYPWKLFVIDQLKNGQIPLWNPYNFVGTPLLGNVQSQVFSPFNLIYFVLPYVYSWSISLILQVVFAFLFTFIYARKMQINKEGAVFAAVTFSCCLYMAVFFEYGVFGHTILWLPLILYGIEVLLTKLSLKGILTVVFATVFAAFGGHVQVFLYVVAFALLYLFIRVFSIKEAKIAKIGILLLSFIISLGISSIQFLPSLKLIGLSARSPHAKSFFFEILLLQIHKLILFIAPDFYGNPTTYNYLLRNSYPQTALYIGVLPLVFALSVVFLKKNSWLRFYCGMAILVIIGITNNPLSEFVYSLPIPFLASSSPTNGIFLESFSLSILAGYAMDQWIQKKNIYPLLIGAVLLFVLAGMYGTYSALHWNFSNKNAIFSLLVLGIVLFFLILSRFIQYKKMFVIIFILFTIFDLFYFFQKFNPFVPKVLVYPEAEIISVIQRQAGINRVWGYGNANIASNINTIYHFASPDGDDPLYPKRYGELIYAAKTGHLLVQFNDNNRSNAIFDSTLGTVPQNKYALKLLNLFGVKYLLDRQENGSTEKTFPIEQFSLIYNKDGWKIFENKQAVPRFFLTRAYQIYRTNQEFEKIFFSSTFNPSNMLLLEESPSFASNSKQSKYTTVLKHYSPNDVEIQVATDANTMLFLSDMYYPGWRAYVDGKRVKIFRADYDFRALVITPGKHLIQFLYQPATFSFGFILCIISITLLFVICIGVALKRNNYVE